MKIQNENMPKKYETKTSDNQKQTITCYTTICDHIDEQNHIQMIDVHNMNQHNKVIGQLLRQKRNIFAKKNSYGSTLQDSSPFTNEAKSSCFLLTTSSQNSPVLVASRNNTQRLKRCHKKGISLYSNRLTEETSVKDIQDLSRFSNFLLYVTEKSNTVNRNQNISFMWKKLNQIQRQIKEVERIVNYSGNGQQMPQSTQLVQLLNKKNLGDTQSSDTKLTEWYRSSIGSKYYW